MKTHTTKKTTGFSHALLGLIAAITMTNVASAAPVDTAVQDMTYNGEGIPRGLPTNVNWRTKGRVGKWTPPSNAASLVFWGHVYEDQNTNPLWNARVALRYAKTWVRWGSTWYNLHNTSSFSGGNYREDYGGANDGSASAIFPGDIRWDGSVISVRAGSKSSVGSGYNYHFWDAYHFSYGIGAGNNGVIARVQFKLIRDWATSETNLSSAAYLVGVGADYYTSSGGNLYDVAISRLKYATTSWRSVYMHNLSESDIRSSKPSDL
jgi:hypothetical protein